MNVKSVILIVAALLFAGGTAFVASRLMGQKPVQQVQVQEAPGKKVLVAKGNLPAGTFLKEEDVSWQKWPTDGVNDNYLLEGQADINNVVGAVVRKGIVAGEPITESQIARPGDRGFLAAVLTPGMRAIAIDVNEPSSVAGLVFPGDRIDVLLNMQFTIKELSPDGQPQTSDYRPQTSETVLENVRLLATDRNLNDIEGEPKKINTVTIEVTPKQAEMIKVAATMGQLALSLRGLGMPDGKAGGPTVASAQTAATSFFAQQAADTPGGPEESKPKDKSGSSASDDDPVPQRGETYTYDTEVSRPMNELMHPTDKNVVQIVRGSNTGDPAIQNIVPQ
ncbi:MAG TPA: Flp pilus assembly protein CpaB [Candidatus Angelobacter sp.]|nr:Flp pilus assembly protein CpaB [Candidatus Angelobacter sp.]